jgi:hypothetical protein
VSEPDEQPHAFAPLQVNCDDEPLPQSPGPLQQPAELAARYEHELTVQVGAAWQAPAGAQVPAPTQQPGLEPLPVLMHAPVRQVSSVHGLPSSHSASSVPVPVQAAAATAMQ